MNVFQYRLYSLSRRDDFHLKSWKSDFETSKDATYKEIWIMLHYHLYVPLSRSFFMLENYTFIKSNILMSASFRLIRLLLLSKAETISLYPFKRFTRFNATRISVSFFFFFPIRYFLSYLVKVTMKYGAFPCTFTFEYR